MAAKAGQATCSLATEFKQEQVLDLINVSTGELAQHVRCIADTIRSRSKNAFAARRAFTVVDVGATATLMDACRKLIGGPHFQAVVPCYLQHHRDSPYFTLSFKKDEYCGYTLYIAVPAVLEQGVSKHE